MRKFLLTYFLLLAGTTLVSSQSSYNEFIKEGAHWQIDEYYCDELGTCDAGDPANFFMDTYHGYYKLQGDTLLDSILYKKMYKAYWAQCDNCPNYMPRDRGSSCYKLFALLTEDTATKKVYWRPVIPLMCDTDSVFLDFSRQPADSFNVVCFESTEPLTYCITDSFTIDSSNNSGFDTFAVRTSYYFDRTSTTWGVIGNTGNLRLFEGIGFSYGFRVEYGYGDCNCVGSTLMSYWLGNDSICPANFPNAVNNITPANWDIKIYPDPASNNIVIKSGQAQLFKATILDLNGKCIFSSSSEELNISSLTPGLYFLSITTSYGIIHKSFIKQ